MKRRVPAWLSRIPLPWISGSLTFAAVAAAAALRLSASGAREFDGPVLAIAALPSGGAVVGGDFSPGRIARIAAGGLRDESYTRKWETGGFDGPVLALVADSRGGVIAGGAFRGFDTALAGSIARIAPDGTVDVAFLSAAGAGFDGPVRWLGVEADGKILVAGDFSSFNGARTGPLARLHPEGGLDSDFGLPRPADGPVTSAVRLDDGSWIAAGDGRRLEWLR